MRIRSIKPEFWRDETIVSLPISARLTFIGLWSYVDDNGVGDARVSSIVADLYADDMSRDPRETLARVADDLQALSDAGLTVTYSDPGHPRRSLIFVRRWTRHQKIDRPSKGNLYPLPPAEILEESNARASVASASRGSRANEAPGAGEQGNRGTGEQTTTSSESHDRGRAARESSSTFSDGTPIPEEPPTDDPVETIPDVVAPTEIGTAARARLVRAEPAHRSTVRMVLGGAGYPAATIDQLARQVAKLTGKHPPELIAEALREWDRRPDVKPAFLGSVLGDVVKAQRAEPAQGVASTKAQGWLDLINQLPPDPEQKAIGQ